MIDKFEGPHKFLSNFFPCQIPWGDMVFPSVEHAYQAAKSDKPEMREFIRTLKRPGDAKSHGKKLILRKDWEDVKVGIMHDLLFRKYSLPSFKEKLLATGDEEIIEGNYWHDEFWGVCSCPKHGNGENRLGKLIMQVRGRVKMPPVFERGKQIFKRDGYYTGLRVLKSNAGFFIGRLYWAYEMDGYWDMGSRESEYFPNEESATRDLESGDFIPRDAVENQMLYSGGY